MQKATALIPMSMLMTNLVEQLCGPARRPSKLIILLPSVLKYSYSYLQSWSFYEFNTICMLCPFVTSCKVSPTKYRASQICPFQTELNLILHNASLFTSYSNNGPGVT
jgi:hypothetical protein